MVSVVIIFTTSAGSGDRADHQPEPHLLGVSAAGKGQVPSTSGPRIATIE
jgi:hypothetical protein